MNHRFTYETKIGNVMIEDNSSHITKLCIAHNSKFNEEEFQETPLIREAAKQLYEYLDGKRKTFDLPLSPAGTLFQQKVWDALQQIPYGETRSYKEIATMIGNEKASRAVGMANNKNPIFIVIPCHRVIGTNGKLVGYAYGLTMKEDLLNMEKTMRLQ